MNMIFSTSEYVRAHRKEPRGLGTWFFRAKGKEYDFFGKYSEAKKLVKEAVKKDNLDTDFITIEVLS